MAIELGLLLELKWTTDDIQDDKKGEGHQEKLYQSRRI